MVVGALYKSQGFSRAMCTLGLFVGSEAIVSNTASSEYFMKRSFESLWHETWWSLVNGGEKREAAVRV
jgi:hypothetical protein